MYTPISGDTTQRYDLDAYMRDARPQSMTPPTLQRTESVYPIQIPTPRLRRTDSIRPVSAAPIYIPVVNAESYTSDDETGEPPTPSAARSELEDLEAATAAASALETAWRSHRDTDPVPSTPKRSPSVTWDARAQFCSPPYSPVKKGTRTRMPSPIITNPLAYRPATGTPFGSPVGSPEGSPPSDTTTVGSPPKKTLTF